MRYQTPQLGAEFVPVQIAPPEVFIKCEPNAWKGDTNFDFPFYVRGAHIAASGVEVVKAGEDITILVPTGKLEDTGVVSAGTTVATLAATIFVLVEIFCKRGRSGLKDD